MLASVLVFVQLNYSEKEVTVIPQISIFSFGLKGKASLPTFL